MELQTYLRTWAKLLNCTVLSVDYSLAPENPFPRPTEEVLFAYAWAVKNPRAVGMFDTCPMGVMSRACRMDREQDCDGGRFRGRESRRVGESAID